MSSDLGQRTHAKIVPGLCGRPVELGPGRVRVVLDTGPETKFLGPVVTGDRLEATAEVERSDGRKRWVMVVVSRAGAPVMEGQFLAVVPDRHILDAKKESSR